MSKLCEEQIREEVKEQGNIIVSLNRELREEYKNLYDLIIRKSNLILNLITSKLPNVKSIPLFCSYFNEYNCGFVAIEAISTFKEYALDNNYLTEENLKLISKDLSKLYFLSDMLAHHMNEDFNSTCNLIYGCVNGDDTFFITESLKDCFYE